MRNEGAVKFWSASMFLAWWDVLRGKFKLCPVVSYGLALYDIYVEAALEFLEPLRFYYLETFLGERTLF